MIQERLRALREEMAARNIDIYVVPTADFHESEYVGEYFKARKFITGFTGSAGTAVITGTEAGLWTDGRYFLQAENQLQDTTVTLYRMGMEGVPLLNDFIREKLPENGCLGFDGRCMNAAEAMALKQIADDKQASLAVEEDLIDLVWTDRPALSCQPARIVDLKFTGEDASSKLARIRGEMEKKGTDLLLISSLCDIAWILNIRGKDISYVPVVLSYMAIRKEDCLLFVQEKAIGPDVRSYLEELGVKLYPYDEVYHYVKTIDAGCRVWLDSEKLNYRICSTLPETVTLYNAPIPSEHMKAVKNPVEMENARTAHRKDAIAMIEFLYWIKNQVGKIPMTEISVSDHLAQLRAQQEGFLDLSFATIAGYAEHGAIIHYGATPETDVPLKPEAMILVDSGGHYNEGTTDITRTIILGPVTQEMKEDFTRVAISMLNLANARFRYGCSGLSLDILARQPFWDRDCDYNHGTGHGVGNVLNVHEGPQGFRWKALPGKNEVAVLEEGMITSDEPGFYLDGKYGIRTENEVLCRKGTKNEYAQFMYLENLTYVPIDLDGIIPEMMSPVERKRLNEYHEMVYNTMAPLVRPELLPWLQNATRQV